MINNLQTQMQRLEEMRKENPTATHVYVRRTDMENTIIDVPISNAEFYLRQNPSWVLEDTNKSMDDKVEQLFQDEEVVAPLNPSESLDDTNSVPVRPRKRARRSRKHSQE